MPDITIAGATFRNVPSIDIPKDGGGTASFVYEDGSKSITENGTHDVSGFAEAIVNVSGGGGASNYVHGEFTTLAETGVQTLNIDYLGNGYPIAIILTVKGGLTSANNTNWRTIIAQYAVGTTIIVKRDFTTRPLWQAGPEENCTVVAVYKSSSANATALYTANASVKLYTKKNPTGDISYNCVRIYDNTVIKVFIQDTSYGLQKNTDYEYRIIYSS